MVHDLDEASHQSSDPPDAHSLVVVQHSRSGGPGRPRLEIDPQWLSFALDLQGPTRIAQLLNCSARSVRRRALELGLVLPGPPVRQEVVQDDGTTAVQYTSSSAPVSTLSDADLDLLIASILETFPDFGQHMIGGHLRSQGHRVPRERIAASYVRVHGAPGVFGGRRIARRVYRVAGPNSLSHHDGQHGMLQCSDGLVMTHDCP